MSVSKGHEAVGFDAGFDQLAETGDAETGGQVLVADAAGAGGGNADHGGELVFFGGLGPAGEEVGGVVGRAGGCAPCRGR